MKIFLLGLYLVFGSVNAQNKPFIVSLETKNLHGKFPRVKIEDATPFRYQITGLLFDEKEESSCTGTLIGPRHVITAAHCVYDFDTKTWSEDLAFFPNVTKEGDLEKGGTPFKKFFIQREYANTKKEEYDMALIELQDDIGEKIGWAGFRSLTKEESARDTIIPVVFAGYPGDKDFGTLWSVACPGRIKGLLMYYLCDSFSGMSGSSLFKADDTTDNFVIGVHTWGGENINGGMYLNSRNYNLLNNWKNSPEYLPNTVVHLKK